jgi:hypothetical protein
MILLLKYYFNKTVISSSSIIIYFSFITALGYIYIPALLSIVIIDLYMFTILNNFTINKEVSIPTKCKIEFVAEGQELSKTDDLAKTLIEYGDKMNG